MIPGAIAISDKLDRLRNPRGARVTIAVEILDLPAAIERKADHVGLQ